MSNPIYAVGYARVSTAKQATEGDSLPVQAGRIERLGRERGWTLFPSAAVFQEPFTGTTENRPVYRSAIRLIKQHPGKVKYFIISRIDRFSREGSRGYLGMKEELAALGVILVDAEGVIRPAINTLEDLGVQYKWSLKSPSRGSELAEAEAGHQEVTTMLTRMIGSEIRLTRTGYHIGAADDGYMVKRTQLEDKKRCVLVPDPERSHFFRMLFEMRAAGTHSDSEIVAHVNGLGFRTKVRHRWNSDKTKIVSRTTPKPLTVKRLQAIVLRPIYCGYVLRKWTNGQLVRARGESVVSVETFNRANRGKRLIEEGDNGAVRMLYDRHPDQVLRKRNRFSDRWPYKNVILCPECRKPLWASASRGRSGQLFSSYHCARTHARYSIRQPVLDAAFSSFLGSIRFVDEHWEPFTIFVREEYRRTLDAGRDLVTRSAESLRELADRKDQLVEAFTQAASASMRASIEAKVEALDTEIASASSVAEDLDVAEADLEDFLAHVRKTLEHPVTILGFVRNIAEQLALYRLFFEEFPTPQEIKSGTAKLAPVFKLFSAAGTDDSDPVGDTGLDWNTIHREMLRWKEAYWAIDVIYERMMRAPQLETPPEEKKAA